MSRLNKKNSTIAILSSTTTKKNKTQEFRKITITMRDSDIDNLSSFVEWENLDNKAEPPVSKSSVIRDALNLLYKKKKFHTH